MSKLDEIKEAIDRLTKKLEEAMLEEKHAYVLEENTFWENDEELYYLCEVDRTPVLICLNDGKVWMETNRNDALEKAFDSDFRQFTKISRERAREML